MTDVLVDFKEAREKEFEGVLLGFQKRWNADRAVVKVMVKSRRIGISWTEAGDDVLYAASASGDDVWYIGYNKDMAIEFIQDAAFWAKLLGEAASEMEEILISDEDKDILSFRITFASGHRITALSSRPTNLRGKQGRVIIDEAAFHDNFPGLLKAAIALTMWGGTVRIISSHFGDDNDFNALIQDIRAGKLPYSLHEVTLDQALADGLYQRICKVLGREWSLEAEKKWREDLVALYGSDADEELFCIPSGSAEIYLSRALVMGCMDEKIPVVRWKCKDGFAEAPEAERVAACLEWCRAHLDPIIAAADPNRNVYFGEDFGRSGDLTVIKPLIETQTIHLRALCVIELRNVPFKQQEQILFYFLDRVHFSRGAMDARGNGQYLAEVAMQRYGSARIEQVMLTTEFYRENMPKYKAAFEDKTITLPKDADILSDHRLVRMEKGVAKVPDTAHTKGADGGQRHGDAAVAGMLAIYAAEKSIPAATGGRDPERGSFNAPRKGLFGGLLNRFSRPDREKAAA
jgi:phage FluMu gp28-like protein